MKEDVDISKCLICVEKLKDLFDALDKLNKKEKKVLMLGIEQALLDDKVKKVLES